MIKLGIAELYRQATGIKKHQKTSDILNCRFPASKKKFSSNLNGIQDVYRSSKFNNSYEYLLKYIKDGFPETRYKNNKIQCKAHKNRSVTDLFSIVRSRFKDISIDKFMYELMMIMYNNYNKTSLMYCPDINKIVVRHWTNSLERNTNLFDIDINGYINYSCYSVNYQLIHQAIGLFGIPEDGFYEFHLFGIANEYVDKLKKLNKK